MSLASVVVLIAALDAFVIAALACVCLIPHLIDKPKPVEFARPVLADLSEVAEISPAFEAADS